MNLSKSGLDRISGYEGYHKALPDGGCCAYQETYNGKKDKWTIGFGCTVGVYPGLVWTREQADAAFRSELSRFEAAVNRLVTVDLNQNQFDALVSFAYNCGESALQKSKLLKKLNSGDYVGAAAQFKYWNNVNGKPVKGLTERRASEANLFMKPVEPPPAPAMPQTVQKAPEPLPAPAAATATAATGGFFYTAWQYMGDQWNAFFDGLDEEKATMLLGTAQKHGVSGSFINILLVAGLGVGIYVLIGHVAPKMFGSKS